MTASDPRVGEIAARLAAATLGPWTATEYDHNPGDQGVPIIGGGDVGSMEGHLIAYTMTLFDESQSVADAEFIAAAPADLAYLLAQLLDRDEKLARVEKVRQELFDLSNDDGWTMQHRAAYRDASRAIRAAVAAATGGGER